MIGFAGSPWTLATYMVGNDPRYRFKRIKALLYDEPALLHQLLDRLTEAVIAYLAAQIRSGVDAVMLFDSWGGILSESAYRTFSLAYLARIAKALKSCAETADLPVISFTKGGGIWIETMVELLECDALGVDWQVDLRKARQQVKGKMALQGNMDPAVLHASPARIQSEVKAILTRYGSRRGHIFNLGHGIMPDTDPSRLAVAIDAVHEISATLPD